MVWGMPTLFRQNGYRFFFYSNEGNPREPVHVHVMKGGAQAKIWIAPEIRVERSNGLSAGELRYVLMLAGARRGLIERTWHGYFG